MAQNTLQVSWDLAKNQVFIERITVAAIRAAIAVQAEATETENHAARSALAYQILQSSKTYGLKFAEVVAADPGGVGLGADTIDSDLLFTVNSVYNAMAIGG